MAPQFNYILENSITAMDMMRQFHTNENGKPIFPLPWHCTSTLSIKIHKVCSMNQCSINCRWEKHTHTHTQCLDEVSPYCCYLASNSEIETSFWENFLVFPLLSLEFLLHYRALPDSVLVALWLTNAGAEGVGRLVEWLLSMMTILAMVGLWTGSSCTHSNPICMHLNTSWVEQWSTRFWSITCKIFPWVHFCQTFACEMKTW